MRSRWTTYALLAAVVVVWGVVVWKIFAPAADVPLRTDSRPEAPAVSASVPDTLRLDYADPFLKNVSRQTPPARRAVISRMPAEKSAAKPKRERVNIVHLGTVSTGSNRLYILTIGDEQYESPLGGEAGEFVLEGCDGDSLYLVKAGVKYGVKLCG